MNRHWPAFGAPIVLTAENIPYRTGIPVPVVIAPVLTAQNIPYQTGVAPGTSLPLPVADPTAALPVPALVPIPTPIPIPIQPPPFPGTTGGIMLPTMPTATAIPVPLTSVSTPPLARPPPLPVPAPAPIPIPVRPPPFPGTTGGIAPTPPLPGGTGLLDDQGRPIDGPVPPAPLPILLPLPPPRGPLGDASPVQPSPLPQADLSSTVTDKAKASVLRELGVALLLLSPAILTFAFLSLPKKAVR